MLNVEAIKSSVLRKLSFNPQPSSFNHSEVWDGDWAVLEEYGPGNAIVQKYLQGYHGLVKTLQNNVYYYQDELGSTSHVASSTGSLLEYYKYDMYGKPKIYNASGTQISATAWGVNDLGNGGSRWMPEIGLYDDRHRFMSPDLGRFLQPDPIGFKGDASNLYRYCGNDWANRTDPMGLDDTNLGVHYAAETGAKATENPKLEGDASGHTFQEKLSASEVKYQANVDSQHAANMRHARAESRQAGFRAELRRTIAEARKFAQAGSGDPRTARTIQRSGNLRIDTDGTGPNHGDPTASGSHETAYQPNGRSLNADTDPYVAIPTDLLRQGVRLGDPAVLIVNGRSASGVVGDTGADARFVEASVAMVRAADVPMVDRPGRGPVPDTPGGAEVPATMIIYPSGAPDR